MTDGAGANFEHFARGEPIAVDVGEIERELGSLWQAASHSGGGQTGAVARAALWNLVIPARGHEALAKTKALVDAIAPAVYGPIPGTARSSAACGGSAPPNRASITCAPAWRLRARE